MIVTDTAMEGDATRVSTNYSQLPETVEVGSKILIDNGALECEVTEVQEVRYISMKFTMLLFLIRLASKSRSRTTTCWVRRGR